VANDQFFRYVVFNLLCGHGFYLSGLSISVDLVPRLLTRFDFDAKHRSFIAIKLCLSSPSVLPIYFKFKLMVVRFRLR
jgi:hypothetical protein